MGGINVIKMMVDSGGNRKPGQIWIASMQKVRFSNIQDWCDQAPPSPKSSNDLTQALTLIYKRRKKAQYSKWRKVVDDGWRALRGNVLDGIHIHWHFYQAIKPQLVWLVYLCRYLNLGLQYSPLIKLRKLKVVLKLLCTR